MPRGTIFTYESGTDLVVEWRIAHFSTLRKHDGASYWSPEFSFADERWCLWIHPNGWSGRGSSEHVDLRLRKYCSGRSIRQFFSLSLKTAKGEKYNEQQGIRKFEDDNEFHRFNRFISRYELFSRSSDLMPDDDLTVICTMKGSTSSGRDINTAGTGLEENSENVGVEASAQTEKENAEKSGNICVVTFTQTGEENEKSESICVETSTQSREGNAEKSENICVETSTQTEKEIAEKSENICVETSTQTEKEIEKSENICVETSTQTEKEIGEEFESIFVVTSAQIRKVNAENDLEQNSENTSVEPCTQMDETNENSKRIYVNASTQTGEENEERDWMTDVLDFLKAGNGIDVTFEVETPNGHVEFFAHKLILAMRSPFFADEFYGEGKSDAHLVIPLKGINPKAFMEMLRYCYDNKPRMRSIEEACVLFKVASDFKILNLQKLCHAFIRDAKVDS